MPSANDGEEIKTLTFAVGRLAGAVEALTSRLNRTDEFIDTHFRDLNTKVDGLLIPLNTHVTLIDKRVTTIEAQRGRIAIPASVFGAISGTTLAIIIERLWK